MIKRIGFGLKTMKYFLNDNCTSFSIIKRELLHFIYPSLYSSYSLCFDGIPIFINNGLTPIGNKLEKYLLDCLKSLMLDLKKMMFSPKNIGSNLLKSIMYIFSMKYDVNELSMVINELKLFDAIKYLLNKKNIN